MTKWFWWDDKTWIEYDKKLTKKLEKAWSKSENEVKIDNERFVDIQNMCQRRYDDPEKKRGVKREQKLMFDECFYGVR